MSDLPEGWIRCTIGSLCDLINGRAFKPTDWSAKGLPIVRIQNLNEPDAPFNHFDGEVRSRFLIDSGALLFAWSGTPGTSFGAHIWNGGPAVLNQHIFNVTFDEEKIDKRFFQLAINQKLDELIDKAHGGVGLRHVTKGKFEATEIDLPPLNEQRRIVTKLDSLFKHSKSAREELARIPRLVERYKQAILAAAMNGDENGRSWPQVPLEELITEGPTNGYSPRSGENPSGTLSLKLTATTRGVLDLSDRAVKRLNEVIAENSKFWLRAGDILIQRANSLEYVGVAAIYEGPSYTYVYPDLMIRIRVASPILGRWIWRYCSSTAAREYFISNASGTAGNMPKINGSTIRKMLIPLPPMDQLETLLRRLGRALDVIDAMRAEAVRAHKLLDRLDKATLAKAFRGELVSSDSQREIEDSQMTVRSTSWKDQQRVAK